MTLDTPPLIMLIIFLLVVVYIAKSYLNKKTKFLIEQTSCNITFDYHNQKYILNALIDTGNIVKTIWNEDVIFINEKILNTNGGERRVYYKTVSGIAERNGVKLKNIKYKYGGIDKINDAVIVSSKNISNEFDAIVSFNFIKGGIENGNTIINKKACTKTNL